MMERNFGKHSHSRWGFTPTTREREIVMVGWHGTHVVIESLSDGSSYPVV